MSSAHAIFAEDIEYEKANDIPERRHAGLYRLEVGDSHALHMNGFPGKSMRHAVGDVTADESAALFRGVSHWEFSAQTVSGLHGIKSTVITGVLFVFVLVITLALSGSTIGIAVFILPLSASFLLFMLSIALEWKISDSAE